MSCHSKIFLNYIVFLKNTFLSQYPTYKDSEVLYTYLEFEFLLQNYICLTFGLQILIAVSI